MTERDSPSWLGTGTLPTEANDRTDDGPESQSQELSLTAELSRLRAELARHERRELLVEALLKSAAQTASEARAEARAEATKILKKARERGIEMTLLAKERLESADNVLAAARNTERKLLGDVTRREEASSQKMAETVRSAEEEAARLRASAETDAAAITAASKAREANMLENVGRELAQAQKERQDLRVVWSELHDGLSQLVWALSRLETRFQGDGGGEPAPAAGPDEGQQALDAATVDPPAPLGSLADAIKARVRTPAPATQDEHASAEGERPQRGGDEITSAEDRPDEPDSGAG